MITIEFFEQAIDTALNKAMALDPEMPAKLSAFSGKVISIHFKGVDRTLYLLPEDKSIRVLSHYDGEVDTRMSGSPISIIKMMIKPNVATLLLKGEVEITGDTRLGNEFKKLFREMDLDWQQPVARVIGDGATNQLESQTRKIHSWGKKSLSSFSHSLSEYLQEESRDVVTETELDIFNQQVDTIRDGTDRLQARFQVLVNSRVNLSPKK